MPARPVYVTGYGPFPGVPHNPTADLADALDGRVFGGRAVHSEVLPVSYARATTQIRATLTRLEPALIVHLGVDIRAARLRIESTGVNSALGGRPDVDGDDLGGGPLAEDEGSTSAIPIANISRLARAQDLPRGPVLKLATSPFPSNTYGIEISQPPGVRLLKCVRGRARVVKLIPSSRRP